MADLLLVTGSRVLADHPQGRTWAEAELAAELASMGPRPVVLTGGAEGPDTWAIELAQARGLRWVIYWPDGWRQASHEEARLWRAEGPVPRAELGPEHELTRDEALVDAALAAHQRQWRARVLGLKALWSKTDGTGYTLREAARARLPWRRAEIGLAALEAWAPQQQLASG